MTAQASESTASSPIAPARSRLELIDWQEPEVPEGLTDEEYDEVLHRLSVASVERHFDAFADIDWDHPDFEVRADDPRWVLPHVDPVGRHPWYRSLPLEEQIRVGQWRYANIFKVGLQFENILIRGIMQYVFTTPNGSREFRYLTHEATEECHHTQMFQQGVNRIGTDAPGMPRWLRRASSFLPLAAGPLPLIFFIGVLAGEEPIDHTQKAMLRDDAEVHPMIKRIMEIHVAEEARHISFAHEYIKRKAPRVGRFSRFLTSISFPIVMRVLGDAILVPAKEFQEEFDIPDEVLAELFWGSAESKEFLSELFSDVRMLAEESGLMNPVARRVWKALGIHGRASRYRSEPATSFA
ncbi:diiron oxygenase [Nocardioides zeae]|uniref:Diiron oxygenase n=1 Tax=Nocardioides imazamoxiresistens TaxID=3231893 RepID=A0ABU3PTF6_9ACTN|nr:diiron oxygenase [Nocardioides zeae]MDT9592525.1 diiron oxygenase [Nocardioides zeae]